MSRRLDEIKLDNHLVQPNSDVNRDQPQSVLGGALNRAVGMFYSSIALLRSTKNDKSAPAVQSIVSISSLAASYQSRKLAELSEDNLSDNESDLEEFFDALPIQTPAENMALCSTLLNGPMYVDGICKAVALDGLMYFQASLWERLLAELPSLTPQVFARTEFKEIPFFLYVAKEGSFSVFQWFVGLLEDESTDDLLSITDGKGYSLVDYVTLRGDHSFLTHVFDKYFGGDIVKLANFRNRESKNFVEVATESFTRAQLAHAEEKGIGSVFSWLNKFGHEVLIECFVVTSTKITMRDFADVWLRIFHNTDYYYTLYIGNMKHIEKVADQVMHGCAIGDVDLDMLDRRWAIIQKHYPRASTDVFKQMLPLDTLPIFNAVRYNKLTLCEWYISRVYTNDVRDIRNLRSDFGNFIMYFIMDRDGIVTKAEMHDLFVYLFNRLYNNNFQELFDDVTEAGLNPITISFTVNDARSLYDFCKSQDLETRKEIVFSSLATDNPQFFLDTMNFILESDEIPKGIKTLFALKEHANYSCTYDIDLSEAADKSFYKRFFYMLGYYKADKVFSLIYQNTCQEYIYWRLNLIKERWYLSNGRKFFYRNFMYYIQATDNVNLSKILEGFSDGKTELAHDKRQILALLARSNKDFRKISRVSEFEMECIEGDSGPLRSSPPQFDLMLEDSAAQHLQLASSIFPKLKKISIFSKNRNRDLVAFTVRVSWYDKAFACAVRDEEINYAKHDEYLPLSLIEMIQAHNSHLQVVHVYMQLLDEELLKIASALHLRDRNLTLFFGEQPKQLRNYRQLQLASKVLAQRAHLLEYKSIQFGKHKESKASGLIVEEQSCDQVTSLVDNSLNYKSPPEMLSLTTFFQNVQTRKNITEGELKECFHYGDSRNTAGGKITRACVFNLGGGKYVALFAVVKESDNTKPLLLKCMSSFELSKAQKTRVEKAVSDIYKLETTSSMVFEAREEHESEWSSGFFALKYYIDKVNEYRMVNFEEVPFEVLVLINSGPTLASICRAIHLAALLNRKFNEKEVGNILNKDDYFILLDDKTYQLHEAIGYRILLDIFPDGSDLDVYQFDMPGQAYNYYLDLLQNQILPLFAINKDQYNTLKEDKTKHAINDLKCIQFRAYEFNRDVISKLEKVDETVPSEKVKEYYEKLACGFVQFCAFGMTGYAFQHQLRLNQIMFKCESDYKRFFVSSAVVANLPANMNSGPLKEFHYNLAGYLNSLYTAGMAIDSDLISLDKGFEEAKHDHHSRAAHAAHELSHWLVNGVISTASFIHMCHGLHEIWEGVKWLGAVAAVASNPWLGAAYGAVHIIEFFIFPIINHYCSENADHDKKHTEAVLKKFYKTFAHAGLFFDLSQDLCVQITQCYRYQLSSIKKPEHRQLLVVAIMQHIFDLFSNNIIDTDSAVSREEMINLIMQWIKHIPMQKFHEMVLLTEAGEYSIDQLLRGTGLEACSNEGEPIYIQQPFQPLALQGRLKEYMKEKMGTTELTYPEPIGDERICYRQMVSDELNLLIKANRAESKADDVALCTIDKLSLFYKLAPLKVAVREYKGIDEAKVVRIGYQSHGARLDDHEERLRELEFLIKSESKGEISPAVQKLIDALRNDFNVIKEKCETNEEEILALNTKIAVLEKILDVKSKSDESLVNSENGENKQQSSSMESNIPVELVLNPIKADGNCFYHAMQHHTGYDYRAIRRNVCDYLAKPEKKRVILDSKGSDEAKDEYIRHIRQDGVFASEPEIHAFGEIYKIPVIILHRNGSKPTLPWSEIMPRLTKDPVFLLYSHSEELDANGEYRGGHYDTFDINPELLENGVSARTILAKINVELRKGGGRIDSLGSRVSQDKCNGVKASKNSNGLFSKLSAEQKQSGPRHPITQSLGGKK